MTTIEKPEMDMEAEKMERATAYLKTLANENRLGVLCHLAQGEKSVSELETLLGVRQPNISQQLARLRAEGLVRTRRDAKSIYYSLDSEEVELIIDLLYKIFCAEETEQEATAPDQPEKSPGAAAAE